MSERWAPPRGMTKSEQGSNASRTVAKELEPLCRSAIGPPADNRPMGPRFSNAERPGVGPRDGGHRKWRLAPNPCTYRDMGRKPSPASPVPSAKASISRKAGRSLGTSLVECWPDLFAGPGCPVRLIRESVEAGAEPTPVSAEPTRAAGNFMHNSQFSPSNFFLLPSQKKPLRDNQ